MHRNSLFRWSFGVLMFEIITLGGTPYPGIQPDDMLSFLESGQRIPQPDNCPDDLLVLFVCEYWLPFHFPTALHHPLEEKGTTISPIIQFSTIIQTSLNCMSMVSFDFTHRLGSKMSDLDPNPGPKREWDLEPGGEIDQREIDQTPWIIIFFCVIPHF